MKGKSLIAACLIIPIAVITLAIYLYANQAKLDIGHYGFFRTIDNQMVVQFDQHLVWLDQYGREQQAFDLQTLDIKARGDYDFFSNGDLLVYHSTRKPGLLEGIASFMRLQKRDYQATRGRDGFYRCDLQTLECVNFAPQLPSVEASSRLVIDRRTDTVYFSDTPAFRLYKIDSAGNTIATSDTETFRFPNQLLLADGALWVADTNHHRIAAVDTADGSFAEVREEFSVNLGGEYRWPHQLTADAEGWWMIVGDNSMAHGRVVHFSSDGTRGKILDLREIRDPVALKYWQGGLWIADFSLPLLQVYSTDGKLLPAVESDTLDTLTAESLADFNRYQALGYLGVGGLILVLISGFAAAWMLERQETLDHFKNLGGGGVNAAIARPAKVVSEHQIYWLTNKMEQRKSTVTGLLVVMAAMIVAGLGMALNQQEEVSPGLAQLGVMSFIFLLIIMALFYCLARWVSSLKLGVIGSSLVLQNGDRRTIARASEITYTNTHLMADNIIIALGNYRHSFFDYEELHEYVFPRLKSARKCGKMEMIKHLWHARDPLLMVSLVLSAIVAVMYIAIALSMPQ
jgi:hypothetical protein